MNTVTEYVHKHVLTLQRVIFLEADVNYYLGVRCFSSVGSRLSRRL